MSSELSNSPDIYFLRGIIYLYSDNCDKAKKMFAEGIRLDPDDEKCKSAFRNVKKLEQEKEKGKTKMIQYLFKNYIGNEAIKKGNAQEALNHYEEALKCDPLNKTINAILYSNRALGKLVNEFRYLNFNKYSFYEIKQK